MKKSFFAGLIVSLSILFTALSQQVFAQMQPDHAKWSFKVNRIGEEEAELVFTASIDDKWHLYSQNTSKGGPLPTVFTFTKTNEYSIQGKVMEPKPEEVMDDVFNVMVRFFKERKVVFKQKIKVLSPEAFTISGKVEYQTCDENMCLSGKSKFSFKVEGNKNAAPIVVKDSVKKDTSKT
ncbi:MAG: protein-disulfide reductase DsbD domain-containing protein, partial [Bacteroidota bacterium]